VTFKTKIKGVLAVLVVSTAGISITQRIYAARPFWVTASPTQVQLQEDYRQYNSGWFAGDLPDNVIVKYSTAPDRPDTMGLTEVENNHFVIYIDPRYHAHNRKAAEVTLLHEMCHIRVWDVTEPGDEHGAPWKACMVGLAENGAFDGLW
jgi:hypothetical protein